MKVFQLRSLVFILATVISICVASKICTKSDEPCLHDDDCCDGYCANKKCSGDLIGEPRLGTADICDRCSVGQKCIIETSCSCSNDCTLQAVCVTPVIPKEIDPCSKCALGTKCQFISGNSEPLCIPKSVCDSSPCGPYYDCIPNVKDPSIPECIQKDLCGTLECKEGYECKTIVLNCLVAGSCPEPYAECVLIQKPCSCPQGTTCVPNADNPKEYDCLPVEPNPCSNIVCSQGYECSPALKTCIAVPDPCATKVCTSDQYCVQRKDIPTIADCLQKDVCVGYRCGDGWKCQMAVMECFEPGCNQLIYPECVPEDF